MTIASRAIQEHAAGRPHRRRAGPRRCLSMANSRATVPWPKAVAQAALDLAALIR